MAGRYVDKELRRRRNRKKKLRKLRMRFWNTRSSEEQERLLEKMRRISVNPNDVPELGKS
jgi:hypothetical protein